MRVPRPAVLLAAYPAGVLTRLLLYMAQHGWGVWSMEQAVVATIVFGVAVGLWINERRFAPFAIVAGAVVGTIEVLGNAVSIPEAIGYVRRDEMMDADVDFYLYLAAHTVVLAVGACALAAAISLAIQYSRAAAMRPLRRVLGVAAVIEAALLACIAYFGLGSFEQSKIQTALLISQLPAAAVLSPMGWCCGVNGGLVFTDAVDPHWGGLTRIGIPILFVTNSGVIALVLLAVHSLATRAWRPGRNG